MKTTQKESKIIFYGNTFIPLSCECEGCHNFNFICEGSVYRGDCPILQVTELKSSQVALDILGECDYNHFILACICGYDLSSEDVKQHIERLKEKINNSNDEKYKAALKKAIGKYNTAFNSEQLITELREKYDTENSLYGEVEQIKEFNCPQCHSTRVEETDHYEIEGKSTYWYECFECGHEFKKEE